MSVPPEIEAIERDASAAGIAMNAVLADAQVNPTTWWRWRHSGVEPKLGTVRRVRTALDDKIGRKAEAA